MSSRHSFEQQPGPSSSALAVRLAARSGALNTHTSGLASAHAQGNLVILPKSHAGDFLRFCQANPKPCPLLGQSEREIAENENKDRLEKGEVVQELQHLSDEELYKIDIPANRYCSWSADLHN